MTIKRKQICIIGLGKFGSCLAKILAKSSEVLAIDNDIHLINSISNEVQRALCLDARDFDALSTVVSSDFDEAIVSIGESLEASILCTLHLKQLKIPVIRVKADSDDHAAILKAIGATQVIFPEAQAAQRLAAQIEHPNLLDYLPVEKDYQVVSINSPESFYGHSLVELQLRSRFGVFVIAIKKENEKEFLFLPDPNQIIEKGDTLLLIGRNEEIRAIEEA